MKLIISRRDFMKGLATGALSVTIVPSWAGDQELMFTHNVTAAKGEQTMTSLPPLFDCSKYLGLGFPQRPDFPKTSYLLAHMDRLGIDRAVAWHINARNLHPLEGNKQLLREIESIGANNRIIPSFIIAPTMIKDSGVMDSFLYLVEKHHIRAFHFFLRNLITKERFGWTLSDIAPLIHKILHYKPVLFLDLGDSKLDGLSDLSGEFPQLSIVCTNCSQAGYKTLFEVMEARSNIYVDTSFLYLYRSIEYIIQRFGAGRLIFGAGYKSNNGASIATLAHAEISPEHAQLIAHGNLERLLEINTPLAGARPIIGDRLWHRLLRREHLGPEIIDAHSHLFLTSSSDSYFWCTDCTDIEAFAEHAIHSMNVIGIRTMIIAGFELITMPSLKANTYLEEHIMNYSKYFKGYFGYNPGLEDAVKLVSRLNEFFSRSFFVGFKLLNDYWRIPVTDPCFIPMWEYANAHRLPILLHTWEGKYDAPKMLADIAPRYPNAIFILGHSGNNDRLDAEKLAMENPNVYLEWCGSFYNPTDWSETLERLGNRQLVYGSDAMYHYPAYEMGRLLSLDVPDETLLPILGDNMRSILAQRR